jgi:subfamily B ATP-binding cassette protein MsbA
VQAKELTNPLVEVISMFGLGLLVVYIFASDTTLPDFVGFLTGVMMLFLPIKKLARVQVFFEQAAPGVERLAELFNELPSIQDPIHPQPWPSFTTEIRLERVSFSYDHRIVLHDFTLVIPRGNRIGIAGASGSGKSTLVNLLFRFYDPAAGRISVDGVDLRDISMESLRDKMALVSQDVVVFDATVAENIAAGKLSATREEIVAAARAASAHEFIMQLPEQYDTRLGERGLTLSGGQRQRVAIARAFVRNAPILVLDEATASLDSKAEAEVQAAIEQLEKNRTVVCVAHRLSTLADMDQIVVLEQGRIIEQGSFAELLEAGGSFANMAARQGIRAAAFRNFRF